ncbi:hypothetical protein AMATHDRAFT_76942 [Amanita thiersii Skay4041]|uniref:Uricase n=1 Tax=Amanita thiersii Skay4041 TaxID=703135 RepID=A0A2A9NAF1_9AGAR|nr:hypothetical protein AMATHDRAFT_76942 [Amanita thiersii Skay4041]
MDTKTPATGSTGTEPGILARAWYGKANVRLFRVVRDGEHHRVVEYYVTVLVEGNIASSYTNADNSVVVATDSIKNITYYLAKISPHVLNAEKFALHLGTHLVSKYAHLDKASIGIEELRWGRIPVGTPAGGVDVQGQQGEARLHPHSFYRDGDDKRVIQVEVDASAGKDKLKAKVSAGIKDLLVLKSTGSAFEGFVRDEYTTLVEVDDRIFSTSVDLQYTFDMVDISAPKDEKKLEFVVPSGAAGSIWDEEVPARARKATLEVFATDESASVQATLYKMAQRVVAENTGVKSVTYRLPNKHYVPVDMKYIGVDNITPSKAEVFMPIAHPSGEICATIHRK